jgi:hypothetical protein
MTNSDAEYENQRFLVIRRFRDLPVALLFDSILDSAAIESFLADKNTIRMEWFWSNFLGGIKLCVRKSDADEALSLLDQPILERFDVEEIGEFQQPRCPQLQVTGNLLPRIEQASRLHSGPSWRPSAASSQSLGVRFLRSPMAGVQGETSGELLDFSLFNTDDRVDGVYLSCLVAIPD